MFKSMSHGNKTLNKDSNVYGLDNVAKEMVEKGRNRRIKTESVKPYPH